MLADDASFLAEALANAALIRLKTIDEQQPAAEKHALQAVEYVLAGVFKPSTEELTGILVERQVKVQNDIVSPLELAVHELEKYTQLVRAYCL